MENLKKMLIAILVFATISIAITVSIPTSKAQTRIEKFRVNYCDKLKTNLVERIDKFKAIEINLTNSSTKVIEKISTIHQKLKNLNLNSKNLDSIKQKLEINTINIKKIINKIKDHITTTLNINCADMQSETGVLIQQIKTYRSNLADIKMELHDYRQNLKDYREELKKI